MIIRAKLNDKKNVYRDIAIDPFVNLYTLASYVVWSFGFNFDHCFGFFSSPDIFGKGKDAVNYELFFDIDEEVDDNTRSVARTIVKDIYSSKKDKWWMLFDYGDDWVFELECIEEGDVDKKSGSILKKLGDAPKQY
jgi:hypothetical protein